MNLSSKQRAYLKSLAANESPIMQIGKSNLTPEITDAVYNQPIVYHSIFNRVLANARNPQNIIHAALELRQSKDACAFRNYMDIIENKRIDKLNKSIISITKDINRLFKDKDESNGLITEIKISLPYLTLETRLPDLDPIFDIFTNRKLNFFKTMLDDVKRRDIANRYNSRRWYYLIDNVSFHNKFRSTWWRGTVYLATNYYLHSSNFLGYQNPGKIEFSFLFMWLENSCYNLKNEILRQMKLQVKLIELTENKLKQCFELKVSSDETR